MNQPLGNAVGNAVELLEALDTLKGQGPADFYHHCLTIASQMLLLAGQAQTETEATAHLQRLISNRQALTKFQEWIAAQGGDVSYVDEPAQLPTATFVREVPAPRSGYIAGLNAREVGLTSMLLGGGRAKKEDRIDHAVGVVLQAKIGDHVEEGQPLLSIHANDEARLPGARQRLLAAYEWNDEPPSPPPLHHQIVG
jgi:pyrimidine-nucleoside phosphorylase